ncbi:MAG: putative zinc-binding metallopeptidase [Cytophagaceae bacterium]
MRNSKTRYLLISFFCFASLESFSENKIVDERTGVEIIWSIDSSLFRKGSEYRAVILPDNHVQKACEMVVRALRKYPDALLRKNLKKIYVMDSIKVNGFDWGGTYSAFPAALYIIYDMNELYSEQGIHHEFSSILLKNYPQFFDREKWGRINPAGFRYGGDGRKMIETGAKMSKQSEDLLRKGFVYQYSTASVEEDFNCMAEQLFSPDTGFWKHIDQHKRLRKKALRAINFYRSITPFYDVRFFKVIIPSNSAEFLQDGFLK